MSADASQLNPVLLHAQNIDLRQQLERAKSKISDLQVVASHSTVHVVAAANNNDQQQHNNDDTSLVDTLKKQVAARSPEAQRMQQQLEALKEKLARAESAAAERQQKLDELEIELEFQKEMNAKFSRTQSEDSFPASSVPSPNHPPPPPPCGAPPPEAIATATAAQQERVDALEKELAKLRATLATNQAEVFRWKSANANATNDMNKVKAELAAAQRELSSSAMVQQQQKNKSSSLHDPDHVEQIMRINEEMSVQNAGLNTDVNALREKLAEAQQEHKKQSAAMAHVKGELDQTKAMLLTTTQQIGKLSSSSKKASGDDAERQQQQQQRIAALVAQNDKLEADLDEEKLNSSGFEAEIAALRSTIDKMEHESSKAKEVAAEAEFDRLLEGSDSEGKLRHEVEELKLSIEKLTSDLKKSQAEHLIMLRLKDKTLLQLNQTSEELQKQREHFQKREEDLLAMIAVLQQQQQTVVSPPSSPPPPQQQSQDDDDAARAKTAEAEGAMKQQRERQQQLEEAAAAAARQQDKLQRDRDSATRDRRKQELMAKLQARTREDQAAAAEIFKRTAASYDKLLKNLREAFKDDAGRGQEEVYYDALWEYERQKWHAENDLKSMQAIVQIRQDDMAGHVQQVREADQTKLTILRMQLEDLGAKPQC